MATSCGYEFQAKHLGFADSQPHQFYHLQWTKNRWIFFVYRFLMFAYVFVWLLLDLVTEIGQDTPEESAKYKFLSNWAEWLLILYFFIAFIVSIVGLIRRHNDEHSNSDKLPWYLKVNWVFYNMGLCTAFIITVFYWAVIGRNRSAALNFRPRTVHLHIVNSILAIIDIFMVSFPTRFLHFIYTILFGIVYLLFLLILHWTGVDSAVYSVLDWANNPGLAVGYFFMASVAMPVVMQAIMFGIYHLRALIARKTVLKPEVDPKPPLELGNVNMGFEPGTPNHGVYPTLP